jgi:hypothetical protein
LLGYSDVLCALLDDLTNIFHDLIYQWARALKSLKHMSQYWFNRCRTFHILTITTDLTSPSETFDISPKVTRRLSVSSYRAMFAK